MNQKITSTHLDSICFLLLPSHEEKKESSSSQRIYFLFYPSPNNGSNTDLTSNLFFLWILKWIKKNKSFQLLEKAAAIHKSLEPCLKYPFPGENQENSVHHTHWVLWYTLWVLTLGRDLGKPFLKTMLRYRGSKSSNIATVDFSLIIKHLPSTNIITFRMCHGGFYSLRSAGELLVHEGIPPLPIWIPEIWV